jgi:hypothetical protein
MRLNWYSWLVSALLIGLIVIAIIMASVGIYAAITRSLSAKLGILIQQIP